MKKILLFLVLLLFVFGCDGEDNEVVEENTEVAEGSECDSYTTDYIIQRCKAIEAEDISLCDPITHPLLEREKRVVQGCLKLQTRALFFWMRSAK